MSDSWRDLIGRADLDPATVKARLSLAATIQELGTDLEQQYQPGRWKGVCPFHDDVEPSLDVWEDVDTGQQRWGCYPCGVNGDVFDFIRELRDCTFPEAFNEAVSMLEAGLIHEPAQQTARPTIDVDQVWRDSATEWRAQPVAQMLADRGIEVETPWLMQEFQVNGEQTGDVIVPHLHMPDDDANGLEAVAVKRRFKGTWSPPYSVRGSNLHHLYGAWRDKGAKEHPRVVVCEGESDTWYVASLLRDEPGTLVVGLPSGAGGHVRDEWLAMLGDRYVVLMLDADNAGRQALRRWVDALPRVRVASLPDGEDACSAGEEAVRLALENTLAGQPTMDPGILVLQGQYARPPRDPDDPPTPISDFTLSLQEVVQVNGVEEGILLRVLIPAGRVIDLSHNDLRSDSALRSWANRLGLTWSGSTRDAQGLLRLLMTEAPFVPLKQGVEVAGLHGDAFVLPNLVIGPASRVYVPPVTDVGLGSMLSLGPGKYDRDILQALHSLHLPGVMSPLLGWIAAAPLRSLREQFPIFAVVGGSGYGKTTVVREALRAFGFEVEVTLTNTTPHAISSFAQASNAIPLWVDEYRPGARYETKVTFDQIMRDAWDGKASAKGGMQENRSAVTFLPSTAPILVTGEDALTETSHLERSVIVPLPPGGRNPGALARVQEMRTAGFGLSYLTWLQAQVATGALIRPPLEHNRREHALAMVRWGYDLLSMFSREHGYDLPDFDASIVGTDQAQESPWKVAINEAFGQADRAGSEYVWVDGDDVFVRTVALVRWVDRETDIVLPGGSRAMDRDLQALFVGSSKERTHYGRATRLPDARAEIFGEM